MKKQPQWDVNGATCIHAFLTPELCGKPALQRPDKHGKLSNGWLCKEHYRQFQASIPPKPRHSQPKWKGLVPQVQSDEEIIADIIATDATAIALGVVVRKQHGSLEPVYFRTLESVGVN